MKKCTKCKIEKPLEAFGKDKSRWDGLNAKCKECGKAAAKQQRETNPTYGKEWYQNNADRAREYARQYHKNNPEKFRKRHGEYRARQYAAEGTMPVNATKVLIEILGPSCMHPDCDSVDVTLDHVVPLSRGGRHSLDNAQLLCRPHNSSKCNYSEDDYRTPEQIELLRSLS